MAIYTESTGKSVIFEYFIEARTLTVQSGQSTGSCKVGVLAPSTMPFCLRGFRWPLLPSG